jgi:hypothetical protein
LRHATFPAVSDSGTVRWPKIRRDLPVYL